MFHNLIFYLSAYSFTYYQYYIALFALTFANLDSSELMAQIYGSERKYTKKCQGSFLAKLVDKNSTVPSSWRPEFGVESHITNVLSSLAGPSCRNSEHHTSSSSYTLDSHRYETVRLVKQVSADHVTPHQSRPFRASSPLNVGGRHKTVPRPLLPPREVMSRVLGDQLSSHLLEQLRSSHDASTVRSTTPATSNPIRMIFIRSQSTGHVA